MCIAHFFRFQVGFDRGQRGLCIIAMKRLLSALSLLGLSVSLSAQAPLWDLAKDKIPAALNHGAVQAEDGSVTVGGDNYFGVPPAAFPDQKNFTVQAAHGVRPYPAYA